MCAEEARGDFLLFPPDVPNWLFVVVATGNLLDLEEVAKAPLSTVSANTNKVDETPRPQVLGNNSVVWVSSSVARAWFWDPVSFSQVSNKPGVVPGSSPETMTYRPLGGPDPAQHHPGSGWSG